MKYPSWSHKPHIRKRQVTLTSRGWVVQETGELLVSNVQLMKSIQAYFRLQSTPTIDEDTVNINYDGSIIELSFADLQKFIDDPSDFTVQPMPDPSTAYFTSAQYALGITGSVNTTKNAGRIYTRGALTLWSGFISGSEAKLTTTTDFGDFPGLVQVAVDGSAFVEAPNTGSVYTLFTGLEHATRFVEVRYAAAAAEVAYIASSGNVLEVTGRPPALVTLSNKVQNGAADSATGLYSGAQTANLNGYTPTIQASSNRDTGSNVGSIKLRGAFNKLVVTLNGSRKIGVSKNGAAPAYYSLPDEDGSPIRAIVVPCDGSTSTYYVWDSGNAHTDGGHFVVAGDSTLLDIGTRKRIDQYGDSITFGSGPGATSVDTEIMRVAASMGYVGSTNGISGLTIEGCKTMLDLVLPMKTVTSDDVAILAIGGNNIGTGIGSSQQADYGLLIDKLLAKGYGKILCRGILPAADGSNNWATQNGLLHDAMTAKANAKLVWIETSTWLGYETLDGAHPTVSGYTTIAGYAAPAYASALGA